MQSKRRFGLFVILIINSEEKKSINSFNDASNAWQQLMDMTKWGKQKRSHYTYITHIDLSQISRRQIENKFIDIVRKYASLFPNETVPKTNFRLQTIQLLIIIIGIYTRMSQYKFDRDKIYMFGNGKNCFFILNIWFWSHNQNQSKRII